MILQTTPELDEVLAEACKNAGIQDPVELVRRALSLYVMVAEHRVIGRAFLMQDIDGTLHEVKVL